MWFNGTAKEAAAFYCSVFEHSVISSETPMVVDFKLSGFRLLGLNGGPMFTISPSISLFVSCETVAETDRIYHQLIEGGSALMPIDEYPWSPRYGWLKDRFGLTWQVSLVNNPGDPAKIFLRVYQLLDNTSVARIFTSRIIVAFSLEVGQIKDKVIIAAFQQLFFSGFFESNLPV